MRWEPADDHCSSASSSSSAVTHVVTCLSRFGSRFGAALPPAIFQCAPAKFQRGDAAFWVGIIGAAKPANGWEQCVAAGGGGADELDPDVSAAGGGGVDAGGGGVGGIDPLASALRSVCSAPSGVLRWLAR